MSAHTPAGTPVKKVPIHLQSAQNRLLIKGGKIVNDDQLFDGDVYVEDGLIKQVGKDLTIPGGTRTIDAKGKLIIPGGIDTHTNLQTSSAGTTTIDDFYRGSKAALAGGTTMIMNSVLDSKGISLLDAYDKFRSWADEKVCCDYGLQVGVSWWSDKIYQEMDIITREKGVNAFKLYTSFKDVWMLEDPEMYRAMERCKQLGALAMVHCGNGHIVSENQQQLLALGVTGPEGHEFSYPEDVEAASADHAITMANQMHCPVYIMSVMSKSTADIIAKKRQEGVIAYGEPLAASLGTDGSHYYNKCWRHAAAHVMSPPLRLDPGTPSYLMDLVSNGDLQAIGSSHCTFNSTQKAIGKDDFTRIPNGVNGVEDRMSLIWEKGVMSGKMDPCKFVAATSTNAAKIFNIYPRKGRIAVGSDADIVIWDPHKSQVISAKTHHQGVDFNIFEGLQCRGVPLYVISNGRVVVEEGEIHVTQGAGRFIPMAPFSPFVYMRIQEKDKALIPRKIDREPYDGPVADSALSPATNGPANQYRASSNLESPFAMSSVGEFHNRPPTRGGTRNLQDSSFSLSGAQFDDNKSPRPGIRVNNPPGGRSTGLW